MRKIYLFVLMMTAVSLNAQIVNIPNPIFKAKLLQATINNHIAFDQGLFSKKIDTNNDGEIQVSEALTVYGLRFVNSGINDFTGLEAFTNLIRLECMSNFIPSLNVSTLVNLKELDIRNNLITTLDTSTLTNLEVLKIADNPLGTLDVSNLTGLKELQCYNSQLTSLNVMGLNQLKILGCYYNQLTSLNISSDKLERLSINNNNISSFTIPQNSLYLDYFDCSYNAMSSLDCSGLGPEIQDFQINNNSLTSLEFPDTEVSNFRANNNHLSSVTFGNSTKMIFNLELANNHFTHLDTGNRYIFGLAAYNNQLKSLIVRTTHQLYLGGASLSIYGNPDLRYICTLEKNVAATIQIVNANGLTNVEVNSYCSFTPGGTFYTISGSQKFDSNANGCDAADSVISTMKIAVQGTSNSTFITVNNSGEYNIPLQEGSYTFTPILENPYYNVTPSSVNVTFSAGSGSQVQNFCVTANGTKNDIDVNIIPITAAVPGFDVTYKIIYRNLGNTTINGNILFTYNDAVFDYVSTSEMMFEAPNGTAMWTYSNFKPFETREIFITLNLNGPMETPAVNGDDILTLTAHSSLSVGFDENQTDNSMTLQQTVVNSMDPNDKTCLEGNAITPAMVGKYVHYKIRFENEGTAPAQNIVVKDMIDMAKFDITSLIPLDSNYPFTTRINGNKVEFIFENINLPFDDDLNDGYVVFKIKTLPTLVAGDTFSNTASIYFDYNFPVITDPAVTTVAVLGVTDNEVSAFSISPNPTSGLLNITAKNDAVVKSVTVYNVLGQVVMAVPNAKDIDTVDVSALSAGNYILKVASNKGGSAIPFIKK